MWRLTAVLWLFIWCCSFLSIQIRIVCTCVVGLLQWLAMFMKRLRLFRIERALLDHIWLWYYIPFMCMIACMHAGVVFFGWGSLHAVSAFNLWHYKVETRRVDLCVSIVLCMTLYALEKLVWDQFFKFIRV